MTESEKPRWKINKAIRDANYKKTHRKSVTIQFYNSDQRYLEIWRAIPNKMEWLQSKLDEYAKENSLD